MKVVFINTLYAPHEVGGAERAVRVVAESLVAIGGEAVVITLAPNGVASVGEVDGVRVYYVPLFNVGFLHGKKPLPKWRRMLWHVIDRYNPVMQRRIKRILEIERPDLVEGNNLQGFSVAAWKAAAQLNIPVMQVLHDYYLACLNSTMYRNGANCSQQCSDCKMLCAPRREASQIPAVVSAVSQRTLARVRQMGMFSPTVATSVGPTGIKLEHLHGAYGASKIETSELVLGYLGRIEHVKGVELLLEGVVAPTSVFSRIDILVVPSLWEEPLTRVIAEAYAAGVPVAVSRLGGMPEIVDEGVTGYVFEANGAGAIRTMLEGLPKRPLSSPELVAARVRKSEGFSVQAVFDRHHRLWQDTLAGVTKQVLPTSGSTP
ncbi:MAG: glycosyltransferase [Burkholderiales bacterium]|nr:glycosyltransferase [Burkholderiales bacterium]